LYFAVGLLREVLIYNREVQGKGPEECKGILERSFNLVDFWTKRVLLSPDLLDMKDAVGPSEGQYCTFAQGMLHDESCPQQ